MSESQFLKEFFEFKELKGQPNLHYFYPSSAWKLMKLEDYMTKNNNTVNYKKIENILSAFTKTTKMYFPKNFLYLSMGTAVHNIIQENPKVQEKYYTEYTIKTQYRCLTLSGRIDCLSKDYQNVVEIKTSKYNANLRDYYILQMQIYDWMFYRHYNRRLKDKIILVISNNEISEYKVQSNFDRVYALMDFYIKSIHLFEKTNLCKYNILEFDKSNCDFEKYKKENGLNDKIS